MPKSDSIFLARLSLAVQLARQAFHPASVAQPAEQQTACREPIAAAGPENCQWLTGPMPRRHGITHEDR